MLLAPHRRRAALVTTLATLALLPSMPVVGGKDDSRGLEAAAEALLQPPPLPALETRGAATETAPAEPRLDPLEAIRADGSIALSDGSSYYIFTREGDFSSGPLGMSGRTLEGRWHSPEKGKFVVTARRGWLNGIFQPSHHRIVFHIGDGTKKAARSPTIPAIMEFAAYFLIEEFVSIPAPPAPAASPTVPPSGAA